MVGEGESREGRARELLEATSRGEGFEPVFCPGDQVGLERRGEGEPLAAGDASASWSVFARAISTTGRVGGLLTLDSSSRKLMKARAMLWSTGACDVLSCLEN